MGLQFIKNIIKKYISHQNFFKLKVFKLKYLHYKQLKRIRKKEGKINIVFFILHKSIWKYDKIYQLFANDDRFNTTILICPYGYLGEEFMKAEMNTAYDYFKQKGYNVIKALKEDNIWLDPRKELEPDIIFWGSPYYQGKFSNYYIMDLRDILGCYVPYNFGNSHLLEYFYNLDFHNVLWKLFAETDIHKEYSEKTARNKGNNVIVTGFPGTDVFLEKQNESFPHLWKHKDTKKIIWAPHHTIISDGTFVCNSSFNIYCEEMFSLLEKYKGKIEIVFKPHPLLKPKLYDAPNWGKEKTDEYYNRWENHPYGGLNLGDYVGLFKSSDAMIHDSGSFLTEYLYTEKPVLRTDRDDTITDRLNSFGKMAYNVHYIAKEIKEIEKFIEMVINNSEDTKKAERIAFKQQYLIPPNGKTASENIYDFIKSQLNLK